ncbi:PREDICTED: MHC class II transactivator-like [Rhinopithecus bieti]|uniref:MHC class II transactivator-like n=1 Tax=Rhinopithecus bieti TaxID=61621 RepID=UPI00083C23DF|nr:PREDICTED: MHC class II transactivator-like [Rhinopithecus bieti]
MRGCDCDWRSYPCSLPPRLGPISGPQAFPKLVQILTAFSSLQHLDLDALSENKIGDEGVSQLSATFPQLKSLETLK